MTVHDLCAEKCMNTMERIALQQLIEWKNRADRKPLILNGARQVGKTWLLHEFARNYYKKEAYVVCRKNQLAQQLFGQDFNVERILRGLRAMTSVDISTKTFPLSNFICLMSVY